MRALQNGQAVEVDDPDGHWEQVYSQGLIAEKSWYEREPVTSMRLIDEHSRGPSASVIDVGAGESFLVDRLLARGVTDVTVLDVSEHALSEVRQRLGDRARDVTFVGHDIVTWTPTRTYDVWHDRAVFHFLTAQEDRERYVAVATGAVRVGGCLVLATFAEDGPTHCSGLPVCRYSAHHLGEVFADSFAVVAEEREEHVTPAGVVQPFTWIVLRRT